MAVQAPGDSQTAQDYVASQLRLEADAREALPYQFDTCTKPLGPLRQSVYACLTCNPPPAAPSAGVCYSCSISCHGDHRLVELFSKRDFECDCGTPRLADGATPCSLRGNSAAVGGDGARPGNKYNQNFQGKFCACGNDYDPETEKGTMFQCIGLGTVEDGGCGEDWWHPECLMGLPRILSQKAAEAGTNGGLETVKEETEDPPGVSPTTNTFHHSDEVAPPDGFPSEDDFDHLICYKCVDAFPWIKRYAGSTGFLTAGRLAQANGSSSGPGVEAAQASSETKKRKAEDGPEDSPDSKKPRSDPADSPAESAAQSNGNEAPRHARLPPAQKGPTTLFLDEDFRDHLCRCRDCFPLLAAHPQLLEEEESYEPPLSETDSAAGSHPDHASLTGRSVHSGGSLLERGEAALSSMDRVRAIEGVMAYNHVRDKVKAFLQPYAESGQPVGAEDIKAYFAKLRGDEMAAMQGASGQGAANGGGDDTGGREADHRREQGGC